MPSIISKLAAICAVATSVLAHSWVDCVKYDPINKTCLGYPRGYPGRQDVNINTEYTYLFSGSPAHQAMCNTMQQSGVSYSAKFPMATAQPGETIYTTWEENGHLNNASPTEIKVLYYSDASKEFMDVTEKDTAKVAGTMKFATDGNCYKPNDPNSVCFGSWTVPEDLQPGKVYHFVWFWYFNANPAGQWYTTCFDVMVADQSHVVSGSSNLASLLGRGEPSLDYAWGVTSKITAQINDVSRLNSGNSTGSNQEIAVVPHAAASSAASAAAAPSPATSSVYLPTGDSGRNPDPATAAPAPIPAAPTQPVSSAPAPMPAAPTTTLAPASAASAASAAPAPAPASDTIYTIPNPLKPNSTLKCRRRRRPAH
ncbi:hypothetical protein GQ54DRAFT_189546 [Martensiomyces pterosporus]|nr:hypothetical protein GQ54DRAFT_189546 [Martensiomyces pterosporus]